MQKRKKHWVAKISKDDMVKVMAELFAKEHTKTLKLKVEQGIFKVNSGF